MAMPFNWKTQIYRKTDSYIRGTHFDIVTPGTYHYKVYFYEGNRTNSESGLSMSTKPLFLDSEGKESVSGKYKNMTRQNITDRISTVYNEPNLLGLGVVFVCDGYEILSNDIAPSGHRILLYANYEYSGAVLGSPRSSDSNKMVVVYSIGNTIKTDSVSTLAHELFHVLGLAHKDGYGNNASTIEGDIDYGNPHLGNMPIGMGFIAKQYNGSTEDSVCGFDCLYNTTTTNTVKIYGTLNSDKYPINNPDDGGKIFYSEGGCMAFLWDNYKKEIMYQMPVDKNGYFEFRIRVLPPTSQAPFNLLICSKEINWRFIHIDYSLPDKESHNASIVIGINKNGENNSKYYACVEDHVSNNKTRPISGKEWYNFWLKTKYSKNVSKWHKDRRYYVGGQYVNKPKNGYIYYTNIGKFTTISAGNSYDVATLISTGDVSGSLSLTKKASRLHEIYKELGVAMEYSDQDNTPITSSKIQKKIDDDVSIKEYDFNEWVCNAE